MRTHKLEKVKQQHDQMKKNKMTNNDLLNTYTEN